MQIETVIDFFHKSSLLNIIKNKGNCGGDCDTKTVFNKERITIMCPLFDHDCLMTSKVYTKEAFESIDPEIGKVARIRLAKEIFIEKFGEDCLNETLFEEYL